MWIKLIMYFYFFGVVLPNELDTSNTVVENKKQWAWRPEVWLSSEIDPLENLNCITDQDLTPDKDYPDYSVEPKDKNQLHKKVTDLESQLVMMKQESQKLQYELEKHALREQHLQRSLNFSEDKMKITTQHFESQIEICRLKSSMDAKKHVNTSALTDRFNTILHLLETEKNNSSTQFRAHLQQFETQGRLLSTCESRLANQSAQILSCSHQIQQLQEQWKSRDRALEDRVRQLGDLARRLRHQATQLERRTRLGAAASAARKLAGDVKARFGKVEASEAKSRTERVRSVVLEARRRALEARRRLEELQ